MNLDGRCAEDVADTSAIAHPLVQRRHDAHNERIASPFPPAGVSVVDDERRGLTGSSWVRRTLGRWQIRRHLFVVVHFDEKIVLEENVTDNGKYVN